jgi:predicted N-acetyltransferase YhbS
MIRPEHPTDAAAIETLLDVCFGAERFNKTAYRFREGVPPVAALSYVVEKDGMKDGTLAATIRYWPVYLPDGTPSVLLGPIAVHPSKQSEGIGATLMQFSMNEAKRLGYTSILLVGDAPYYARFGFTRNNTRGITLPGWVDYDRFLGLEYVAGVLAKQNGVLGKWAVT